MIYKVFAVRDAKLEAFLQPFFAPTLGSAIRSLTEAVNDKDHTFYKHAEDYHVFELAQFDDTSGLLSGLATPNPICSLFELMKG